MQQREGIGSIRGEPRQRPLCVVHSPCHQILTRTIALMNHTKKSRLWAEEEDQRPQKQSVWPCFPPCFPNLLLSRDRERASQQQQQSTEKNPCAAEVGAFFMAFSYFKPRLTLGINQDWKRQFSQHIWGIYSSGREENFMLKKKNRDFGMIFRRRLNDSFQREWGPLCRLFLWAKTSLPHPLHLSFLKGQAGASALLGIIGKRLTFS